MCAAKLHADLQRLFNKYGLGPPRLREAQLVDDISDSVKLEGLASTVDRDLEFCRFVKHAFGPEDQLGQPPLLYDHEVVAGHVDSLSYDGLGQLVASVTASHPIARRCSAFSVGARVLEYQVIDRGNGDFEALITNAKLTDISLVKLPVNPRAVVLHRRKPAPHDEFYSLMRRRVDIASRMLAYIKEAYT